LKLFCLSLLLSIKAIESTGTILNEDSWNFTVVYENYAQLSPNYELAWNITTNEFRVQVIVHNIGWIGFGIHQLGSTDEKMVNGDVYTAIWNQTSGELQIDDRFAPISAQPDTDADTGNGCVDNILPGSTAGIQVQNGNSSWSGMRFARRLHTGDTNCDWDIVPGQMRVLWAFGPANNQFYYHRKNAGIVELNFFAANGSSPTGGVTGGATSSPSSTSSTTGQHHSQNSSDAQNGTSAAVVAAVVIGVIVLIVSVCNVVAAVILKRRRDHQHYEPIREKEPLVAEKH